MTNLQEKFKYINEQIDGKLPGEKDYRWLSHKEIQKHQYYLIHHDPRGDAFVIFATKNTFNEMLTKHIINSDTGADFATTILIIVKKGEPYTPTIS